MGKITDKKLEKKSNYIFSIPIFFYHCMVQAEKS